MSGHGPLDPAAVLTQADHGLLAGVLRHAATTPDGVAVSFAGRQIRYAELVESARMWAASLLDLTGGRAARIGVFAARNETAFVGVLAALFAGAAFVPQSRRLPAARVCDIIERAQLDAIVVDGESLPILLSLADRLRVPPPLLMPDAADASLRRWPARTAMRPGAGAPLAVLPEFKPDALAYLIFTSGSTGQPKAVAITHGNVRTFLDAALDRYRLTADDRLSQTFEPTFDLAVFDMFMAWESGASVCVVHPFHLLAPVGAVERLGLTVWFSVPSVVNRLMGRHALPPGSMPGLHWSLFCGEPLPRASAEAWQAAAPNSVLESLYGPTELTIACAAYRWDPVRSPAHCVGGLVPIGAIHRGLPFRIVSPDGGDVVGEHPGELLVGGAQTSPGYWQSADLTAERFVTLAGPDGLAQRYYRTGDLVRRDADRLIFRGRNDDQVKIGGHRVELGEVEARLRVAGCAEAVALAWPPAQSVAIVAVVAWSSGAPGAESFDPAAILASLALALPDYMLPRSIHRLDALPRNVNGKLDRAALRDWLAQYVGPDGEAATP